MRAPHPSPPPSPSLFNSLITSRARAGRSADALSLLARMLAAGVPPTAFTFALILSSPFATACCAAQLHTHILKRGLLHCEPYSGTSLVGFFRRSGRFDGALKVFGEMTVKSMVTWNCQPTGGQQLPAAGRPCTHRKNRRGQIASVRSLLSPAHPLPFPNFFFLCSYTEDGHLLDLRQSATIAQLVRR
jgi:pentatricopeptide repeat protein